MIDFSEINEAAPPEEKEVTRSNNFEYAGDDYLSDYLREIDTPKQEQPAPEFPEESEFEQEEEPVTKPSFSNYQLQTSSKTAFFVVQKADQLLSAGVAAYAHAGSSKEFEATPAEIQEIADHLGVYFAENAFQLPPWLMAAVPGLILIQRKFSIAGKLRQANMEKEKALKETAELRQQIEKLKAEKEVENLKKEVETLKTDTP